MLSYSRRFAILLFGILLHSMVFAETVGIFLDNSVEQIKFAAGDVKAALEAKGFTVEQLALSSLSAGYANKKVVITLASNTAVAAIFNGQGGVTPTGLTEQAYALLTTTQGQASHWIFGGDDNGAMYGGFQLAENITFNGYAGPYAVTEKPHLQSRGMKINLPFDKRLPTYSGYWTAKSAILAIPNVWDSTYWKSLIDHQARNRYNMITVWSHHFFPALVKVPGYEKACLPDIQYYDGTVRAELTHEARVAFWRRVMQYAHSRGMAFYFFNWNVYVDYAQDHYPQLSNVKGDLETVDYMSKSMRALLETYPELDGFGVSAGDGMYEEGGNWGRADKVAFTWQCYGKVVQDYLATVPARKFDIIHRSIGIDFGDADPIFSQLNAASNTSYRFSVKYTYAHAYGTPTPGKQWSPMKSISAATTKTKTFLTIRNEDYFYVNWGSPEFVRTMMTTILFPQIVAGFYLGSDNISPTRSYLYKNSALNGKLLEVERKWFTEMLWGRLSYNPATSDDVFKKTIEKRYNSPITSDLYTAWTLASRALPKVTELVQNKWLNDYHWWPEACLSDSGSDPNRGNGFRLIDGSDGFDGTSVANKSNYCSILTSAQGVCGTKKSSYVVANEMQAAADQAILLTDKMSAGGNTDLDIAIKNVKQMAHLADYYACKVRGATCKAAGKIDSARIAMGRAYCFWMVYTRLMEDMYLPDTTRSMKIPDWRWADAKVLKEYTDCGGMGIPDCKDLVASIPKTMARPKPQIIVQSLSRKGILFNLPYDATCSISLFSSSGKQIFFKSRSASGKTGTNLMRFDRKIGQGIYLVKVKAGNSSVIEKKAVTN